MLMVTEVLSFCFVSTQYLESSPVTVTQFRISRCAIGQAVSVFKFIARLCRRCDAPNSQREGARGPLEEKGELTREDRKRKCREDGEAEGK